MLLLIYHPHYYHHAETSNQRALLERCSRRIQVTVQNVDVLRLSSLSRLAGRLATSPYMEQSTHCLLQYRLQAG